MPKGASYGGRKRGKRRRYVPQTTQPSGQAPPGKSATAAPSIRASAPVQQPVPQQPYLVRDLKTIGIIAGLMVVLLIGLSFVL
jgi:type II secretory pathway component HofQ